MRFNMNIENIIKETGYPEPLGATFREQGINFALYSKDATKVTLCLFSKGNRINEINLDPVQNKTGFIWHIFLKNLPTYTSYGYRLEGPKTPFFDFNKTNLLIDPYAKELTSGIIWGESKEYQPLCSIFPSEEFDWEGVQSPHLAMKDLIIYEMHVRGFTKHSSSHVVHPGTFLGIIDKIPYLLELGINAVELMPIQEFNENENTNHGPNKKRLYNFWGYSTVNFFSLMNRYAAEEKPHAAIFEFKTLVKELHRHGIEVILDLVFNHTAEGNQKGPILSFKGIDNPTYYLLNDEGQYENYTGCGNTFNCNHPVARELLLKVLRYLKIEMHVDGFRFDLASIFSRGRKGQVLEMAPLIEEITDDPVLGNVKLIAEAWDAAGLYQVGNFYHYDKRWCDWNGRYRDSVRRFIKGTPGSKGEFSGRLCGSQDLYAERSPSCSINFIVSHDGFTLQDLVSYNHKHNSENGEHNRDGMNENESWNCGHEGPTSQNKTLVLRAKQKRNFHLALMVSLGIPMLLMGDEYGHTKKGNNNTWCQDNELNWFLWDQLEMDLGFKRFYCGLIHFRKKHELLRRDHFLTDQDVIWHGNEPLKPMWNTEDQFVAFTLLDRENNQDLYIAFNAKATPFTIEFPEPKQGMNWHWIVNTSQLSPKDYYPEEDSPIIDNLEYKMAAFSSLLLKALPY
jgi:isoamylase